MLFIGGGSGPDKKSFEIFLYQGDIESSPVTFCIKNNTKAYPPRGDITHL